MWIYSESAVDDLYLAVEGYSEQWFSPCLESPLVNLELALKRFVCSDVLGELSSSSKFSVAFSSHPKLLVTLKGQVESSRTKTCFHWKILKGRFVCLHQNLPKTLLSNIQYLGN